LLTLHLDARIRQMGPEAAMALTLAAVVEAMVDVEVREVMRTRGATLIRTLADAAVPRWFQKLSVNTSSWAAAVVELIKTISKEPTEVPGAALCLFVRKPYL
jgi:putative cell wall-binding protein